MKKLHIILLATALLIASSATAAIKNVKYSKGAVTIDKNMVLDIAFRSAKTEKAPFEVEFFADFVSPTGTNIEVPAFYNGNKTWVIRFSSSECGEWSYTTRSTNRSLDKKKGSVIVQNAGDRKGAITYNPERPNRLIYEGGEPYFLMGFECDFLFALDYECDDATPRLDSFLDRVQQDGFNHIVMNLYAHDVVWNKDPKLAQTPQYESGERMDIFPFGGDNAAPDFTTLNVEFFKKFDRLIEKMAQRDIVSHLMIYVWNKDVNWPDVYTPEDNRYFEYVVKRYGAFTNIVWDISKEALYYGRVDDNYIIDRIERLRKTDSHKRLMTVHDYGFCMRHTELVDIVSTQDWKLDTYGNMLDINKRCNAKPTYNIEHGGYEQSDYVVFTGNYTNAEYCLRRNYESVFAGTYSTYYWQGCSWNVIAYDWFDQDPTDHYRPKMEYFRHMTELFTRFDYSTLTPMPQHNNSGFCMGDGKGTFLYYLPKESHTLQSYSIKDNLKNISYQWFNTHTGEYTEPKKMNANEQWYFPSSPWHMVNDAVFILTGEVE